jgi:hypothetical protein
MSPKEFVWKTNLFIALPGLLTYGCLREQNERARAELPQRACIKSLYRPIVTTMTILGQVQDKHLVHKPIINTAALRRLGNLAQHLCPVRVVAGVYRGCCSTRHHTFKGGFDDPNQGRDATNRSFYPCLAARVHCY